MERPDNEMESIVVCPNCGEQVYVALSPYQDTIGGIMKMFESAIGVGNTEHFDGKSKCKCGKTVNATLHVTAEVEDGKSMQIHRRM